MAGLFNTVLSVGKSALEKLSGNLDPNLVRSINPSDFTTIPVQVICDWYGIKEIRIGKIVIDFVLVKLTITLLYI